MTQNVASYKLPAHPPIMQVAFLAAGEGSRLGPATENLPKFFLAINDRSIHQHLIEALSPLISGKRLDPEITVILGYGFDIEGGHTADEFLSQRSNLCYNTIILEKWDNFENAYSALRAVESTDEDQHLLILCGDIITTSEQLNNFVARFKTALAPDGFSAVGAFRGIQNEMTAVRCNKSRRITGYGSIEGHQEAGMFILHKRHRNRAKQIWQNNPNEWFPNVFTKIRSKAVWLDPSQHHEINTTDQLMCVRDEFS